MSTEFILDFWKSHPQYWISGKKQAEADEIISTLYFPTEYEKLPFLEAVIYLDQFMRHFSRVPWTKVSEEDVRQARLKAVDLVKTHMDELYALPQDELMFALMPLKHTFEFETIFGILTKWLPTGANFVDYPTLNRFYKDTYKKAYEKIITSDQIISCISYKGPWDHSICESCPPPELWGKTTHDEVPHEHELAMALKQFASPSGELTISLSGGVDSNVLCAVGRRAGLKVRAIHIVYGNREVAEQEAAFLTDYAAAIGVELFLYRIPWLRRATAERAFYETMTRILRFNAYKAIDAQSICLGHIQDDIVENIWTNFAHGTHLDNLAKMSVVEKEDDVTILRPWLHVPKSVIYEVATQLHIPHLKNTTPTWSNRGKFRAAFHPACVAQFGESVDEKILEVAASLRAQSLLLERLLFDPVYESWDNGVVNISPVIKAGGIDGASWQKILAHFCHTKLGISKPSIHACNDLANRLKRWDTRMGMIKIPMKAGLELHFKQSAGYSFMEFVCVD